MLNRAEVVTSGSGRSLVDDLKLGAIAFFAVLAIGGGGYLGFTGYGEAAQTAETTPAPAIQSAIAPAAVAPEAAATLDEEMQQPAE